MAQLTLKQIHEANSNLAKLVKLESDFLLARALAKLLQAITTDVELIGKKHKELFDKYKQEVVDSPLEPLNRKEYFVPNERAEEFGAELDEFLATEVELEFQPIDEKLIENIRLSAIEYKALIPFLKENKAVEIKKKTPLETKAKK